VSGFQGRPIKRDGFDSFLEAAAQHRLLTFEEEQELARKIQAKGPDWKEARNTLVMHNVRLAVNIARQFQSRGVEFEDLVQAILFGSPTSTEGKDGRVKEQICGGIARAAELYDGRGKFSTYATMWAKQAAQRAGKYSTDLIDVPNHIKKIQLTAHNHPELSVAELASKHEASPAAVLRALNAARVVASLDAQKQTADSEFGGEYDLIADESADDPAALVDEGLGVDTRELLARLSDEQRQVVEMKFGLNGYGGREHTAPEIAEVMSTTAEAVRSLLNDALKLLRRPATVAST
jgi:RNA polymerase sigma factor (sigma-70 family)